MASPSNPRGAGRKPAGADKRDMRTISLLPEVVARLDALAARRGVTFREALEGHILATLPAATEPAAPSRLVAELLRRAADPKTLRTFRGQYPDEPSIQGFAAAWCEPDGLDAAAVLIHLFAMPQRPGHEPGVSLGAAARRAADEGAMMGHRMRYAATAHDVETAAGYLRPILTACASRGIAIDWEMLHQDLYTWESDEAKKRWAGEFYGPSGDT